MPSKTNIFSVTQTYRQCHRYIWYGKFHNNLTYCRYQRKLLMRTTLVNFCMQIFYVVLPWFGWKCPYHNNPICGRGVRWWFYACISCTHKPFCIIVKIQSTTTPSRKTKAINIFFPICVVTCSFCRHQNHISRATNNSSKKKFFHFLVLFCLQFTIYLEVRVVLQRSNLST